MNQGKYKTVLCKHFGQSGTCSYGDKCQFAHGFQELKNSSSNISNNMGTETKVKQAPNPSNFKIVKCKNWETTGNCKYGSVCTFAHGDTEVRTKSDNNLQMSENQMKMDSLGGYYPMNTNPFLMNDPTVLYNYVMQQQSMVEYMKNNPEQYQQLMQMGGMNMLNMNGYNTNLNNELNMNDMNPFLYSQNLQNFSNTNLNLNPDLNSQNLNTNYIDMNSNLNNMNNNNNNKFIGNNKSNN